MMLVSTKSGCLGLNMVSANRVVIFEPAWNPCDDVQASSRVVRFGQKKPTFIYRFIVDNSFEHAILCRQTNKRQMSDRVVDEVFSTNKFSVLNLRLFVKVFESQDYNFSDTNASTFDDKVVSNLVNKLSKLLTQPPIMFVE